MLAVAPIGTELGVLRCIDCFVFRQQSGDFGFDLRDPCPRCFCPLSGFESEYPAGAQESGLAGATVSDAAESAELRAVVSEAVDAANTSVSRAESIRAILPHDLTIDAGELTPTLKVRRSVVLAHYGAAIESIYGP